MQARDAELELEKAAGYTDIRLTNIKRHWSETPLDEPEEFYSLWAQPGEAAASFSAICLFWAEQVQDELREQGHSVPIGLVDATWGGTIIEAWSPPEALEACDVADAGLDEEHNHNNYLWNGMIQPLTKLAIRGALWYQGESNTGHNMEIYDCLFENLISSWRQRWWGTQGYTDLTFPFGFVQLGPNTDNKHSFRWPLVRWKQTGGFGFVPNHDLKNVFMAVAMDDDIDLHPKNKRLPSSRLSWAALNLVYGDLYEDLLALPPLMGPRPIAVHVDYTTVSSSIKITFDAELEPVLREEDRFMVCCLASMAECDAHHYGEGWEGVSVVAEVVDGYITVVLLEITEACEASPSLVSGVAYLWLETPCASEENCPLYSDSEYRLPVAPFKTSAPS